MRKADCSYTAYPEGTGTRHTRDALTIYGCHDRGTGQYTQHVGVRRYSLWVSALGDGAITREDIYLDHRDHDTHRVARCSRLDVSEWLPIVRDGVGFGTD